MATKNREELFDLLVKVGFGVHIAADVASKGRLTTIEIKTMIKVLKHILPIAGRVLAAEVVGGVTTGALITRAATRAATIGAVGAVARNPWSTAAALLIGGYIYRDEVAAVGAAMVDDPRTQAAYEQILESGRGVQQTLQPIAELPGLPGIRPLAKLRSGIVKRKVSKANRAVKQGMTWLKAGGKAISGAAAGTLPGGAFRTAVKAAGMANPKTKSKPGKGKSIMNKLARRLKKWW